MGAPRLDREAIVDAATDLVRRQGSGFTLAVLGARLGADPTAIYRHFRDKDELLRAVGDRLHHDVVAAVPEDLPWRAAVTLVCERLRAAHLAAPALAAMVQAGPPRQPNELAITERLLRELSTAGLDPPAAALAYHALIELTVGSAALDAAVAAMDEPARSATYAAWRRAYGALDPGRYPASVTVAAHLYAGGADERFRYALDRLLDGIVRR